MFAGIVSDRGRVRSQDPWGGGRLRIAPGAGIGDLVPGESVACAGICLTVTGTDAETFHVDVSGETVSRTTVGNWRQDQEINLERSLRAGDRIGGHLVTGHVDATAICERVTPGDGSVVYLDMILPMGLAGLIAEKGSVALDGVSLTVNAVDGNHFRVGLVPYTQQQTTLGQLRAGESVNLEIDLVARYAARLLSWQNPVQTPAQAPVRGVE